MIKATWKDALLASSDKCIEIEGNQYFPPESVDRSFLRDSDAHTY